MFLFQDRFVHLNFEFCLLKLIFQDTVWNGLCLNVGDKICDGLSSSPEMCSMMCKIVRMPRKLFANRAIKLFNKEWLEMCEAVADWDGRECVASDSGVGVARYAGKYSQLDNI